MVIGIEKLLQSPKYLKELRAQRIGLVAHAASVNRELHHSLDLLMAKKLPVTCAFGPQHGMRAEKQDNMIESQDYRDPKHGIPVFSLYGEVRRPTDEMLSHCNVILYDLQDVGCRVYTFLTTLFYLIDACARTQKALWILDRPNPAGRMIEGSLLRSGFESFVGGGALPMRHGLTMGEAARWYIHSKKLTVDLRVLPYQGKAFADRSWVNPSPNIPMLATTRVYPGAVMLEGTKLSEGRGTTTPFHTLGAPGLDIGAILKTAEKHQRKWLQGCRIRPCFFEPTFQKHAKQLCSGIQIHVDDSDYDPKKFKPYRLIALLLKSIRLVHPDWDLWSTDRYEYEDAKPPIDFITGSSFLREWVDDSNAKAGDLDKYLSIDEKRWEKQRRPHLLYRK